MEHHILHGLQVMKQFRFDLTYLERWQGWCHFESMLFGECARAVNDPVELELVDIIILPFNTASDFNLCRLVNEDADLVKVTHLIPNHMRHVGVGFRNDPAGDSARLRTLS